MIWTILLKYWKEIAISVVVIGAFIYVRHLQTSVAYWRQHYDQVQATLIVERESHAAAMAADIEQRKSDLAAATAISKAAIEHLQDRIGSISSSAAALHDRLRLAESSRVRPLAPVAAAPAVCGDYQADRSKLPDEDRSFLIGEATAAEELAALLESCRSDYHAAARMAGSR